MAESSQNRSGRNKRVSRSQKSRHGSSKESKRENGEWMWEIRMPHSTRRIWLGSYDMPEMAALAYDFALYCLKGLKSKFNFFRSLPEISCASSLSPPKIQAAAAKYAAERFPLPSEDAAFSTSLAEAVCGNDDQEMSVFPEDMDNGESLT